MQDAVGADRRAVADHDVGMNDGTSADRRAGADHGERADRRGGIDGRIAATEASGCTPAAGGLLGDSTCAARANVRYGDGLRMTAHGGHVISDAVASPFMITALALVDASFDAYLGLARNVRSPGPASSIFATRRISMAASPSTGHSKRRASSPSVTRSRISLLPCAAVPGRLTSGPRRSRRRRRHLLDEAGHSGHVQAMRDLANQAMARRRRRAKTRAAGR